MDPFLIELTSEHNKDVDLDYDSMSDDLSDDSIEDEGNNEILNDNTLIYGEGGDIKSDDMDNLMTSNSKTRSSNYKKVMQRRMSTKAGAICEPIMEASIRQQNGRVKIKKRILNNNGAENKNVEKGKAAKALMMRKKRIERDLAKNERMNELREISDIYKDREGNEVRSVGVTGDTAMQQKKKKAGTCLLSRDATMYTNIINKYRAMQKKNMAKEVRYQDLNINEEEKGVMRIIFNKLGIKLK